MTTTTLEVKKKNPPSPSSKHWLLGNIGMMFKDMLPFLQTTKEEVGDIAWLKFPLARIWVTFDPEIVKYIVQENNKNYTKGDVFKFLRPILGNGLLTSEGDFWKKQRRLIQPAFHKERLTQMTQTMIDCSLEMVNEWKKNYKDGEVINMTQEMNKITLKIVAASLFRSEVDEDFTVINKNLTSILERITQRMRDPFIPPIMVPTWGNYKERKAIKALDKVIESIISKRRKQKEEQKRGDLLDMLLEMRDEDTGEGMSDKQLRDEIMTLFIAGHETTANAMTYLWVLMTENPQEDEKLLDEGKKVLQGGQPTFENLRDLSYTKQIINETLRLYPPAYAFERKSIKQDQLGEYSIPANTDVIIPVYIIHRDKRFWNEPEQFLPERFAPEKIKEQTKYSFFPFGGGPRLCIGEQFAFFEMQILAAMVRQAFRFEKTADFKMELEPLVTLRTKEDVYLKIYHNQ